MTLQHGHTLVRSGPYAWVRHPSYSGPLLAVPALALGRGGLAFLLLAVE